MRRLIAWMYYRFCYVPEPRLVVEVRVRFRRGKDAGKSVTVSLDGFVKHLSVPRVEDMFMKDLADYDLSGYLPPVMEERYELVNWSVDAV